MVLRSPDALTRICSSKRLAEKYERIDDKTVRFTCARV